MAYKKNRYGSIITQDGSTITKKMQEEYKRQVKSYNAKRSRMINQYYNEAKNTPAMRGINKKVFEQQLQDKGFIAPKLSSSMKGFKSRNEFKEEAKDVRVMKSNRYQSDKLSKARERMIKQVEENFNSDGDKIVNVIKNLSDKEFTLMYMTAPSDVIQGMYYKKEGNSEAVAKTLTDLEIAVRNILPKKGRNDRLSQIGF